MLMLMLALLSVKMALLNRPIEITRARHYAFDYFADFMITPIRRHFSSVALLRAQTPFIFSPRFSLILLYLPAPRLFSCHMPR